MPRANPFLTRVRRESANEVLEEYFAKIGGRDSIFKQTASAVSGKKRGRKPSSAAATGGGGASADPTPVKRSRKSNGAGPGAHPANSTPPAASKNWSPPAGSWEDLIEMIDACQDEGTGQLMVYLAWKNGKKTRHPTDIIYKKCPQKVRPTEEAQWFWMMRLTEECRCSNSTSSTLRLSSPTSLDGGEYLGG